MKFKVIMPLDIKGEPDKYPAIFQKIGVEFVKQGCKTEEEFIDVAKDASAIITVASLLPVTAKVLESLKDCRLIANTQVGFDCIDIAAATQRGILVTNVPDYCIEEVADHTMALLLACARKVVLLDRLVKDGRWGLTPHDFFIKDNVWPTMPRLSTQTLGLIGLGRIGRAVAIRAKAFGMRVITSDPYITTETAQKLGVELAELNYLLHESDYISVHAALNNETRHIINTKTLSEMKSNACLINCARGGLIDEEALSKALEGKKIAMAALDVLDTDPPALDNPLLVNDSTLITGHSAFFSPQAEAERWQRPVDEIVHVMKGEWPSVIVNPEAEHAYISRWGKMKAIG